MNGHTNLAHHFLIAMPQLAGSYFADSLIYLCQHNEEGAFGLVINQPLPVPMSEIFEQLNMADQRPLGAKQIVLSGGPVETNKGFILHTSSAHWESTLNITEEICLTTSKDILSDISHGKGPKDYLLALGCSGWGAGQLEQEIADNSWLTCPASTDILFSEDYTNKPNLAAATLGFSLDQLTPDPGQGFS